MKISNCCFHILAFICDAGCDGQTYIEEDVGDFEKYYLQHSPVDFKKSDLENFISLTSDSAFSSYNDTNSFLFPTEKINPYSSVIINSNEKKEEGNLSDSILVKEIKQALDEKWYKSIISIILLVLSSIFFLDKEEDPFFYTIFFVMLFLNSISLVSKRWRYGMSYVQPFYICYFFFMKLLGNAVYLMMDTVDFFLDVRNDPISILEKKGMENLENPEPLVESGLEFIIARLGIIFSMLMLALIIAFIKFRKFEKMTEIGFIVLLSFTLCYFLDFSLTGDILSSDFFASFMGIFDKILLFLESLIPGLSTGLKYLNIASNLIKFLVLCVFFYFGIDFFF